MHFVDAKGILTSHNGINIYRGCTHGCIYCDSRSECYQIKHDFEDIEVKQNAPILLEQALKRKRNNCIIITGAMCDPYMQCEAELKLTRRCLEIIDKYNFGASILTKSDLILRDIDIIKCINARTKCVVQMTLTTYDEHLCRIIEPNVCTTYRRYEVLKACHQEGIPTVVWLTPILPYINDTEENIRGILSYCLDAGVSGILTFEGGGLTLRKGSRDNFFMSLDRYFPGIKEKYIQNYGLNYEIPSINSSKLMNIIHDECEAYGLMHEQNQIFSFLWEYPRKYEQITLF